MSTDPFLRRIIETVGHYSKSLTLIPIAPFDGLSELIGRGVMGSKSNSFYGFFLPEEPNFKNPYPMGLYLLSELNGLEVVKVGYWVNPSKAVYEGMEKVYLHGNRVVVAIASIEIDPKSDSGYKIEAKAAPPVMPKWRVRSGLVELGNFLDQI